MISYRQKGTYTVGRWQQKFDGLPPIQKSQLTCALDTLMGAKLFIFGERKVGVVGEEGMTQIQGFPNEGFFTTGYC
jgi:hypothetical protein